MRDFRFPSQALNTAKQTDTAEARYVLTLFSFRPHRGVTCLRLGAQTGADGMGNARECTCILPPFGLWIVDLIRLYSTYRSCASFPISTYLARMRIWIPYPQSERRYADIVLYSSGRRSSFSRLRSRGILKTSVFHILFTARLHPYPQLRRRCPSSLSGTRPLLSVKAQEIKTRFSCRLLGRRFSRRIVPAQ